MHSIIHSKFNFFFAIHACIFVINDFNNSNYMYFKCLVDNV